jgi:hypothetical protein
MSEDSGIITPRNAARGAAPIVAPEPIPVEEVRADEVAVGDRICFGASEVPMEVIAVSPMGTAYLTIDGDAVQWAVPLDQIIKREVLSDE